MKVKKIMVFQLMLSIILIAGMTSCSKKSSSKNSSRATGWNVDSKKGLSNKKQEAGPGLIFVEGGTFTMGKVQDDVMHDWNNAATQQHVQSFYMDETEVTNFMYLEYLDWLKMVFPPSEENYKNIYEGASPDTLVWRNRLGYNETMTNNYLRHPSYAEYPVVGVNWIQAVEFSKWRTDRVNEAVLEKNGYLKKGAKTNEVSAESSFSTETYLNAPTSTFGGNEEIVLKGGRGAKKVKAPKADKDGNVTEEKNVYAQRSSGLLLPEYRLPTEAEWEYAAAADVGQREYNTYKGQKKYPWSGGYTRSGKRQNRGDQLANFKQGNGDYGGIAGWSDDGADITNEVKKYPANDFGLYDMAGNVAEWVADVYRPIVDNEANDFNYFRGNLYTKNKIGADGKIEIVTKDNIRYDTLSNGRIIARNLPGEIAQIPVDEQETYLRQNFDKSNNINYRDGDKQSSKYYNFGSSDSDDGKSKQNTTMYNSPRHNVTTDSLGKMVRRYDTSNKRSTLINDQVRVYKGGSWRDRAYWLDPAQRRYFPQDMATDYIGFRCAMSRVGPKSEKRKSPRN
ncbi:MAG TPA: gliding motility lipoprotein GldJ [Flavobacterium sp.]|jgi:gliding motility-associated lipoprotein GldJ|uniref:gliding motility lipoprotein GldJ n=1 Tax=Flavobacterium sp. TaxID=239 RepID=UPI001B3EC959|nr:gliding motility lipoprotein GldJ [Flavobacterium sp.]MBP7182861.1 gliding motility lipoprotein GldJ [Flavobacterium sp.]MBP7318267.1 gliding motility lipoprotein GldJ [Flavobacterium sp.]MBP8888076.1 gliding motility lipoprotein GldJ [Flavobacterium sp.]HRM46896.1 gliding motility lipoprotein GldJ [Flavobacterium sp.]